MILLITYDLNKPGQDYTSLYSAIKEADTWWHYLDSTWVISTDLSIDEWCENLLEHMDENDHLFVVEIRRNYCGWLPNKAWDWLRKETFK